MRAPHPLLADPPERGHQPGKLIAELLFGYAVALFVAGVVLAALNGFPPEQSWGDAVASFFFPLVPLAFAGAGLAMATRQAANPLGWICLAIGVAGLGPLFPSGYSRYTLVTNPGSLPLGELSAWMEEWAWILWVALAGVSFLLRFPDGKLLSDRWRYAMGLGVAASAMSFAALAFEPGELDFNPSATNPFGLEIAPVLLDLLSAGLILLPIAVLVALTSLILRFVRSRGEARLQLKWLIAASSGVAMSHVASTISTFGYAAALGPAPLHPVSSSSTIAVIQGIATVTWITVPLAAAVAVLKYRLDSIDRVIRHLVAALVLAAAVVAGYAGLLLGSTLAFTGSTRPSLASSLAAGAVVAALLTPLWRWAGRLADRAVFGKEALNPVAGAGSIG
jgi:hypothetical protein